MDFEGFTRKEGMLHVMLFSPSELRQILSCYSEGVLKKGWKDYAVDTLSGQSIFSVIDHQGGQGSVALYSLSKNRSQAKKSGNDFFYRLFYRETQILRTESFLEVLALFRAVNAKDPKGKQSQKDRLIVVK
ncbi:MAG: hypothetical protein CMH30_03540 [Micavibrio sp.]|nr:hypothetical protein [Micavibrio sp.]|tara:strand:- start:245 stop:637 length:393 start_codon:yes stop_codon:yes gene_type:complete